MPLTMHQASAPVFIQTLAALSNVLDKGVAHCAATGQDAGALIDARLAPDMMTLAEQVKQTCHHATVFVSRDDGLRHRPPGRCGAGQGRFPG